MIGDVIFFKKNESSFISRIIAKLTDGEYTHVGIIVNYNELINEVVIIESDRFVNTRLNRITLDENLHTIYTVHGKTDEQSERILEYAFDALGTKYDYLQILGLFISLLFKRRRYALFNSRNKLTCSELIDTVYYKSGIKRNGINNLNNVTPIELLEVYDFRIRKGV